MSGPKIQVIVNEYHYFVLLSLCTFHSTVSQITSCNTYNNTVRQVRLVYHPVVSTGLSAEDISHVSG